MTMKKFSHWTKKVIGRGMVTSAKKLKFQWNYFLVVSVAAAAASVGWWFFFSSFDWASIIF